MYEIQRIAAADVRAVREMLNSELHTHLLDHTPGAHHSVARADGHVVAVISALPVDPRGELSAGRWLQLVGFAGAPDARHELVRDLEHHKQTRQVLWELGDGGSVELVEVHEYTTRAIQVFEGVEAVRKRPGMYVGGVDARGATHLVRELIANGIDEHLAGHASRIDVRRNGPRWIVSDDGRGIPVERLAPDGRGVLEALLTTLHASGTLLGHAWHVHGGLHGVGLAAVCALSSQLRVQVDRDGSRFEQTFSRGRPSTPLERFDGEGHGTRVGLIPDPEIFGDATPDPESIATLLSTSAALQPGLITSLDGRTWRYPDGLAGWLRERGATGRILHVQGEHEGVRVQVAAAWEGPELIRSWACGTETTEGGSHLDAVRTFFVREPLVSLVIGIVTHHSRFAGRTREKLDSPEVGEAVAAILARETG